MYKEKGVFYKKTEDSRYESASLEFILDIPGEYGYVHIGNLEDDKLLHKELGELIGNVEQNLITSWIKSLTKYINESNSKIKL